MDRTEESIYLEYDKIIEHKETLFIEFEKLIDTNQRNKYSLKIIEHEDNYQIKLEKYNEQKSNKQNLINKHIIQLELILK